MYKISQVAEILGISRSATYKKLERLKVELKGHVKTRKGVKYITEDGLELLKDSTETIQRDNQRHKTDDNSIEIDYLKQLVSDRDKQIQQHIKEKGNLTELLRNSQVLMKQEQDRVLMLEHKLEVHQEDSEDPEQDKELEQKPQTFFDKLKYAFSS